MKGFKAGFRVVSSKKLDFRKSEKTATRCLNAKLFYIKSKNEEMVTRPVNRAAGKVFEEAMLRSQALPIWKDGKIEYIIPNQKQIDELLKCAQKTNNH